MSKIEVDQVDPQSGTTLTLGASGDTINIPSGVTMTNNGTATGFGGNGAANWQSAIKTAATFTAVAGEGYFVDTSSNAITANLPAGSVGAIVAFKDYANNFDTNALTISPNGSEKIGGLNVDATVSTEGQALSLVYADATKGWLVTDSGLQSEASQTYSLDFLVVAGGGAGGFDDGGGGGAGGYRESTQSMTPGTVITVTIGDGGAAGGSPTSGSDSAVSGTGLTTITSTGGGRGGNGGVDNAATGGSGGGGANTGSQPGAAGNSPSRTPSQGNNGAAGQQSSPRNSGGGGGAGEAGNTDGAAHGGDGTSSSITGSAVTRAGGGGGATRVDGTPRPGGDGGGGNGGCDSPHVDATAATANTGGGGGGGPGSGGGSSGQDGGAGGKGVIIISVPDGDYSGTTTGSPTVATGVSGKTVMTFNSTGSYTT